MAETMSAGVSGALDSCTPNGDKAFSTADTIAAGVGMTPDSPTPLTPIGFNGEIDGR